MRMFCENFIFIFCSVLSRDNPSILIWYFSIFMFGCFFFVLFRYIIKYLSVIRWFIVDVFFSILSEFWLEFPKYVLSVLKTKPLRLKWKLMTMMMMIIMLNEIRWTNFLKYLPKQRLIFNFEIMKMATETKTNHVHYIPSHLNSISPCFECVKSNLWLISSNKIKIISNCQNIQTKNQMGKNDIVLTLNPSLIHTNWPNLLF